MSLVRTESDRRCTNVSEEGVRCITRLCYLNPGPECFAHTRKRENDANERRRMEAVAYEQLMKQLGEGERIAA